MNFSKKILVTLVLGLISCYSPIAFSQSTPPLDKPIEKPKAGQISESGRIQEKNDEKRRKLNSPDSDKNHLNNSNVNPTEEHPTVDPDIKPYISPEWK